MDKLIELVRKAISKKFNYITIDEDCRAYGSIAAPKTTYKGIWFFGDLQYEYIGDCVLICNWEDAFIDLRQLKGIH